MPFMTYRSFAVFSGATYRIGTVIILYTTQPTKLVVVVLADAGKVFFMFMNDGFTFDPFYTSYAKVNDPNY